MRNKTYVILSCLLLTALLIGPTWSWFTDRDTAPIDFTAFTAGELEITITDPADAQAIIEFASNLHPQELTIENTGSLPAKVRGFLVFEEDISVFHENAKLEVKILISPGNHITLVNKESLAGIVNNGFAVTIGDEVLASGESMNLRFEFYSIMPKPAVPSGAVNGQIIFTAYQVNDEGWLDYPGGEY